MGVQRAAGPLAGVFRGQSPLNGGGWTRTNEVVRRGIYSPLQLPLCDTPGKWCWQQDLNPQPSDYKSGALPVELCQRYAVFIAEEDFFIQAFFCILQ